MYKRLLDNLNIAILFFDEQLCLCYLNTAAQILLDDSARHLIGLSAQVLFKGSDPAFLSNLTYCRNAVEPLIDYALVLSRPHHSVLVDVMITPMSVNGEGSEIIVELQPIDNRLKIAQKEQLQTQQDTLRLMVRGLAHEIKNPLGGLRGAAQLLDLELTNPELKEYTQIIMAESDRLQNLVTRLLAPTKLPDNKRLNIHEVLERVRWLVNSECHQHVTLHCDYDPSLPELLGDKDQLIQAFLNIVRNAVQAISSQGNVTLRTRACRNVTIERRRYKLAVRCEVIDDGVGIAPDMRDKIFYPMVTSRAEGSGLGLSIAQTLIQQHQGAIECHSVNGCTVFSITLPL